MEMPSGTVPIRLVKQSETTYTDNGFYGSRIVDSVKESEGLPVGIQLTAPYMKD
jgi:hypothetical protein